MHKPITEKKPAKPAAAVACPCTCGETSTKDCPKYDPPVNIAANQPANTA